MNKCTVLYEDERVLVLSKPGCLKGNVVAQSIPKWRQERQKLVAQMTETPTSTSIPAPIPKLPEQVYNTDTCTVDVTMESVVSSFLNVDSESLSISPVSAFDSTAPLAEETTSPPPVSSRLRRFMANTSKSDTTQIVTDVDAFQSWVMVHALIAVRNTPDICFIAKDSDAVHQLEVMRRTNQLERVTLALVHGQMDVSAAQKLMARQDLILKTGVIASIDTIQLFRTNQNESGWLSLIRIKWFPCMSAAAIKSALYDNGFPIIGSGKHTRKLNGKQGTMLATVGVKFPKLAPLHANIMNSIGTTPEEIPTVTSVAPPALPVPILPTPMGRRSVAASAPHVLSQTVSATPLSFACDKLQQMKLSDSAVMYVDNCVNVIMESKVLERMIHVGTREEQFWQRKTDERLADLQANATGMCADAIRVLAVARTPIAHASGVQTFGNLKFSATEQVFVPQQSSICLVDSAFELSKAFDNTRNKTVLDLGCGSGCLLVGLLTKLSVEWQGIGVDINEQAVELSSRNATDLVPEHKTIFFQGDYSEAAVWDSIAGLDASSLSYQGINNNNNNGNNNNIKDKKSNNNNSIRNNNGRNTNDNNTNNNNTTTNNNNNNINNIHNNNKKPNSGSSNSTTSNTNCNSSSSSFEEVTIKRSSEEDKPATTPDTNNITGSNRGRQVERGNISVVLCNPPYLPASVASRLHQTRDAPQSAVAGGQDGLEVYRLLADLCTRDNTTTGLRKLCCPGAVLVLEVPGNMTTKHETIVEMFSRGNRECDEQEEGGFCLTLVEMVRDAMGMTRCLVFRFD